MLRPRETIELTGFPRLPIGLMSQQVEVCQGFGGIAMVHRSTV